MLIYLLIILLVPKDSFAQQVDIQNINKTAHKNCKNIKCPTIEDPVCIKIKKINEKSTKVTFIVAINKCEIQYAKCRPGIDAVIVPMKNCQHNIEKYKRKGEKRFKRETGDKIPNIAIFIAKNGSDENVNDKGSGDHKSENDEGVVHLERNDEKISDETDNEETNEENEEEENEKPLNKPNESKEDVNNFDADYDHRTQDVDYNQYEKDCPSVCPAREVMLCAKCQHNIYRTFLSPCHLRVFNCKYPDEKLELISRQPCMQSAPFLTNFPEAKGRISEPGDQDNVLKFIYCRDKGRLGKDDPRCNFGDIL